MQYPCPSWMGFSSSVGLLQWSGKLPAPVEKRSQLFLQALITLGKSPFKERTPLQDATRTRVQGSPSDLHPGGASSGHGAPGSLGPS